MTKAVNVAELSNTYHSSINSYFPRNCNFIPIQYKHGIQSPIWQQRISCTITVPSHVLESSLLITQVKWLQYKLWQNASVNTNKISNTSSGHSAACPMRMEISKSLTFIVDLTITVNISFPDHFVNLFISKFLSQVGHHMPKKTPQIINSIQIISLWNHAM